MNTSSTEDESVPATETWSDKSKKDMFLGFIVVIAAIALEPLLSRFDIAGLFFTFCIVAIGIIMALIGYFSIKL